MEAKSDCKRISSLIKYNKDTNLGTIRKHDGDLSESHSETLDVMNDQLANDVGGEAPPSKLHSSDDIVIEPSAGKAKESITMEDKILKPKAGTQYGTQSWQLDHIFSENRVSRAL